MSYCSVCGICDHGCGICTTDGRSSCGGRAILLSFCYGGGHYDRCDARYSAWVDSCQHFNLSKMMSDVCASRSSGNDEGMISGHGWAPAKVFDF